MGGWRQAIELALSEDDIVKLTAIFPIPNGARESGDGGEYVAGLPREPVVLCGGACGWGAPSDG
jgi:hypothetical protein